MRTEDVPKHLRDRVAQANPRGAQVGNHAAGWRPLQELKALAAQLFSAKPKAKPEPKLTRATDLEMGRTGPDPDADLYRRAGW